MENLEVNASIGILAPVSNVFEAIVDPEKMKHYFISEGSSRLESGKEITWKFPEWDISFPIYVEKVEPNRYISYRWEVEGEILVVEFNLEAQDDDSTVVTVTEKSMPLNEKGINWLKGNTEGWANCLASLKAYVEHGINLRKGAFTHRKSA